MAKSKQEERPKKAASVKYSKANILKMKRYKARHDLLSVLLADNKSYTLEAVDAFIADFMKGKVK